MRKPALFSAFFAILFLWAVGTASASSAASGEALVVFRKAPGADVTAASVERGMDSFRLASLAAASGARVARAYGSLSEAGGGVFALVRSESRTTKELVEALRARPDVAAVSANHTVRIATVPNDPDYGRLWGLSTIRAPEAWEVTTGSGDVYAAVIDSGIDTAHEDLAGSVDRSLSRNFTTSDTGNYADENGHGTHVSGIIGAAGNNGLGIAGVHWRARLIVLKAINADGTGKLSFSIDAVNHLLGLLRERPEMKLAAVNISLSAYTYAAPKRAGEDPYWLALKAVDDLDRAVIVAAAGNEGLEVGHPAPSDDPEHPLAPTYAKGQFAYPAAFPRLENMIVVGAVTEGLQSASFTNWSPEYVGLAAPGTAIWSTYPTAKGKGSYLAMSGTSQAAPHVSGAAALLLSAYPHLKAGEIKAALLKGANAARNPAAASALNTSGKTVSAYGLLDVKGALDYLRKNPSPARIPAPQPQDYESYEPSLSERILGSGGGCSAGWSGLLPLVLAPFCRFCRRWPRGETCRREGASREHV